MRGVSGGVLAVCASRDMITWSCATRDLQFGWAWGFVFVLFSYRSLLVSKGVIVFLQTPPVSSIQVDFKVIPEGFLRTSVLLHLAGY
jgi:hypothetical protein